MIVSCSASNDYRKDNIDCKFCSDESPCSDCPYCEFDDFDDFDDFNDFEES